MPVVLPAPPKLVQPPPAPKVVSLAQAMPASVPNQHSPSDGRRARVRQPTRLQFRTSRRRPQSTLATRECRACRRPITAPEPASTVVNLGSGSPTGQNMKASGPVAIAGIPHGVPGGTGPLNATGTVAGPVNLGQNTPPPMPKPVGPTRRLRRAAPKVLFKPKPEYTAEAKQLHIEGNVTVRIRVSSTGARPGIGRHQRSRSRPRRLCRPRRSGHSLFTCHRRIGSSDRLGRRRQCRISTGRIRNIIFIRLSQHALASSPYSG